MTQEPMLTPGEVRSKKERLVEVWRRLRGQGPFNNALTVYLALGATLDSVEDEMSGVVKDEEAAAQGDTRGRMYAPNEDFHFDCHCPHVRAFRQTAHISYFGENGALRIQRKTGAVEFEILGADGRSISDLLQETRQ